MAKRKTKKQILAMTQVARHLSVLTLKQLNDNEITPELSKNVGTISNGLLQLATLEGIRLEKPTAELDEKIDAEIIKIAAKIKKFKEKLPKAQLEELNKWLKNNPWIKE